MLPVLEFMLNTTWWNFICSMFMLLVVCGTIVAALGAFEPIKIRINYNQEKKDDKPKQSSNGRGRNA